MDAITDEPAIFAGLTLERPRLMGIVNVTPDSFSDGGETSDSKRATARGLAMAEEGADIIDVGGESTRPGADPVEVEEELRRVVPVIAALADAGLVVSVDTRHAAVMAAALEAGARIVNDVTALAGDRESLGVVAGSDASAVLMHMQGEPRTMQHDPVYDDAPAEVAAWLAARIAACESAGIGRRRLAVDPGIGFGKTVRHNTEILANLDSLRSLGCSILVGASRKSFIARLSRQEDPKRRLPGSLAAALWAAVHGADIVRVHDVAETRQALTVWQAIADTPERCAHPAD